MKTFLVFALFAAALSSTCAAKVRSIKIYHVPWSVTTSSAMRADAVRENASIKVEITDEYYAQKFIESLEIEKMTVGDHRPVSDLRVVVDVLSDDGSSVTFVASRFEIGDAKSGMKRPIDDAFRDRFFSVYEKKG